MPELSAGALREWARHTESVMRGLAHALNNRAAALSAVMELAREPDDEPGLTASLLATEFERMRELADSVRVIGPPRGELDAVLPRDVIPEVLAVLRLHADQRDRTAVIDAEAASPVRVARWMLQRAMIVLCASAPTTDAATRTLRASVLEEGDWVTVRVHGPTTDGSAGGGDSVYVAELARCMGGEPVPGGFRLPSLTALRRREDP